MGRRGIGQGLHRAHAGLCRGHRGELTEASLCFIDPDQDKYHKLVVLIPEVQPRRFWDYLLFNQRGVILDRAIRRGTANVVLCRLRYRLEQLGPRRADPGSALPTQAPPGGTAPVIAPPAG